MIAGMCTCIMYVICIYRLKSVLYVVHVRLYYMSRVILTLHSKTEYSVIRCVIHIQFLEEYLESYTVPPGMKISDGTCNQFFSEVVTRFPAAHGHYYLLDFLHKILKRYRADRCEGAFVLDLLQLGVPKLFAGIPN